MEVPFIDEIEARSTDLERLIAILNGDEAERYTSLSALAKEVKERGEQFLKGVSTTSVAHRLPAINQQWEDLIYKLGSTHSWKGPALDGGDAIEGDFAKALADCLMHEMAARNDDLSQLKTEGVAAVKAAAKERQSALEDKLMQAADDAMGDEDSKTDARDKVVDDYVADDNDWCDSLEASAADSQKHSAQRDLAQAELKGRVEDMAALNKLVTAKTEGTIGEKELVNNVADLVRGIKARHDDIEPRMEEQLTETDIAKTVAMLVSMNDTFDGKEDVAPLEILMTPMEAYRQSDADWRHAFNELIGSALGVETPPEKWWLDVDGERVEMIDSIKVSEDSSEELLSDAVFLDRVLRPKEGFEDKHRSLYVPFYDAQFGIYGIKARDAAEQLEVDKKQPNWDTHVILSTLFDGVMCGFFLDICKPNFLDTRVIHKPKDLETPTPLEEEWVEDNVQLLLSSAKALGVRLDTYDVNDWMDADKHVSLLLQLLRQLADKQLEQFVNLKEHPELLRLALADEATDRIEELTPDDFIPRWFNHLLKRPLKTGIDDFNNDLMRTLVALDSSFVPPVKDFNDEPQTAANAIVSHLKELGLETDICAVDLVSRNPKLQRLLAAQMIAFNNGLSPLSDEELAERALMQEELNARIDDMDALKDLVAVKDDSKVDDYELGNDVTDLVRGIKARHDDIEPRMEEQLSDVDIAISVAMLVATKGDDTHGAGDELWTTPMEAYRQNDTDWRTAFNEAIRTQLGIDLLSKKWWLDADGERVKVIDSIKVSEDSSEELLSDAVFLDRVLRPKEGVEDKHRSLYIPFFEEKLDGDGTKTRDATEQLEMDKTQPNWDTHVILSTLFDGAMCGFFLDMCQPNFMDTRVIHEPTDLETPTPLEDKWVEDNVQLLLSSAKALGVRLDTYDVNDWMDADKHVSLLLQLLSQLADKQLEQFVNLKEHPELLRLALDDEATDQIEELGPNQFVPRWLNRLLKRTLTTEIADFNNDLMHALVALDSSFVPPVKEFGDDPQTAADAIVSHLKAMGLETNICAVDLVARNPKLQRLLAAQMIAFNNGLPALTKRELARFKSVALSDDILSSNEAMVNFLNSLLPGDYAIKNLHKDLSDGVVLLKILDRVEFGSVNWKKVRDRGKIRHKFDKMGNCKYAIEEVCAKAPFLLNLVNASGQDVHDGNQKIIHSLLWQIMRYKAMKTLRELSFDGKHIGDRDILNWANDTIELLPEARSTALRGFKDHQLCTAVFYLELLQVIIPGAVRSNLIAYDIRRIKDLRRDRDEGDMKKRLMNARYAMTVARREGAELFVLPEDLVVLEQKAVMSMLAALMTIFFHEKQTAAAVGDGSEKVTFLETTSFNDEDLFAELDSFASG